MNNKELLIVLEGIEIERSLSRSIVDYMEPPQELYEKIVQELKQRGIWKDDNPGD